MKLLYLTVGLALLCTCTLFSQVELTGELRKWHKITLTFDGPNSSEAADPNPFTDYRLQVTFTNGNTSYTVPGYFAADGNAGESSAFSGNKWRVHFAPDATGTWNWTASFRTGEDVALSSEPAAGEALSFDGETGSFNISATNKSGRDLRGKGRLQYIGERYLQFAETGEYFLKIGADAPENFFAYDDFDNTPDNGNRRKSWGPHIQDWNEGDPTWKNDKGKGIIGAVNYLSEQGQNVFSFLTMNISGDDKNVFPYISDNRNDFLRMDCSKLDQWEMVLEHADKMGMYLHFKTQETENDQLLDGGDLGNERRLYYRELIARFGHHLALNWNIGEENTNTEAQRKAFATFFKENDPYGHNIVIHTYPGQDDQVYTDLLGNASDYTGASLQVGWNGTHKRTLEWIGKSKDAGKNWVVANDEQGNAQIGVPENGFEGPPDHDGIRQQVLWGHLMAGGAGVEYYFGYSRPHSDLTCEDFRSRSNMWAYNKIAWDFFTTYVPFWEMENQNDLVGNNNDNDNEFCFANPGQIYVVYLGDGGNHNLDLENSTETFEISWFNPRSGGNLIDGGTIIGPGEQSLGNPPNATNEDWVALVTLAETSPKPLELTNPGDQNGTEGDQVNFFLNATGGEGDYTFAANGLPEALALDPQTGAISGILALPEPNGQDTLPGASANSPYAVEIIVSDSGNPVASDTISFTWTVDPFVEACPAAGTPCDDQNPETINDVEDGECNCTGEIPEPNPTPELVLTNPGDQTHAEGETINLPIPGTGGEGAYTYSATGLPPDLTIDPATGVISGVLKAESIAPSTNGAFQEENGLLILEIESVPFQEGGWEEKTENGITYYEGTRNSLSNPQTDILDFPLQITTTGLYQFVWRSNILRQNEPTEHNDSWLKFENTSDVVFFGYKGGVNNEQVLINALNNSNNIVYPKGSGLEGPGTTPEGQSKDGFFKIYRSGQGEWKWQSRTSDNDAHNVFVWFKTPGEYLMQVSNRSQGHKIDKMSLAKIDTYGYNYAGNELNDTPESTRSDGTEGTIIPGAAENSPYLVTVIVEDNGNPAQTDTITFLWTIAPIDEPCPVAGTACDDMNPNTVNDMEDGNCNCVGEVVPPPPPPATDFDLWVEAECGDFGENWTVETSGQASNEAFLMPSVSVSNLVDPPTNQADWIRYRVSVPEAGNYQLYARTITSSGDDNSFWVRANNQSWLKWNDINATSFSNQFQWDLAEGELENNQGFVNVFNLESGLNTIDFALREPGIQFDKLLITNYASEPDGMGGSGLACTITGVDSSPILKEVVLFPVPASFQLTILGEWESFEARPGLDEATISNSLGQLVRSIPLPEGAVFELSIDVSDLAPGMYALRIGSFTRAILISR